MADEQENRPGRYHHDGQPTERIAAELVTPRTGTQRAKVLAWLRGKGEEGATDYELWSFAGIGARPHVPGTRREELIADGWPIFDSGRRRRTDTATPAIVWVLREPPRREPPPPSLVPSPKYPKPPQPATLALFEP